ncbi:hypothetical protein BDN70DRAFT_971104 [Pholiota conissans]|uniref:Heterokaryon incompatibility domain-containing protein n=1 Tax=Pholiota conissans TaxID=109636 RepID=A0A9P5Z7K0_9AGAR|nr:hypothetical protein BDN70DRAFT_971104 [Pholiota conissans]
MSLYDEKLRETPSIDPNVPAHRTLLKALQDFVIPLIRNVDTTRTNDQLLVGPEAEKLLGALKDFISCVVTRCQSRKPNDPEVTLSEDETEDRDSDVKPSPHHETLGEIPIAKSRLAEGPYEQKQVTITLNPSLPSKALQDKIQMALRNHVFNSMPIRLLYFNRQESSSRITLVEREAIYALLSSTMQEKLSMFLPPLAYSETEETIDDCIEELVFDHARYAILSHTWLHSTPGEITYGDLNKGSFDAGTAGYQKLANFCKIAWQEHGLPFSWMDTVCINKESSSELDESIRSMYKWYDRAHVCMIYLAETRTLSEMHSDTWFTRGWTLQELLAPEVVMFYGTHWERLAEGSDNDKNNIHITQEITRATTLTQKELEDIKQAPISRRMQLASLRKVTRAEDTAYSLMGIFNVSFSTAYGEGMERAFLRLLQEILASAEDVLDIFNWAGAPPSMWSRATRILPTSPRYYLHRSTAEYYYKGTRPMEPLALTHVGLRIPVVLMPGIGIDNRTPTYNPIGDLTGTANISPIDFKIPTSYGILTKRTPSAGADGPYNKDHYQLTFAVFNFSATGFGKIFFMKTCMAICLLCDEVSGKITPTGSIYPLQTHTPITFDLKKRVKHEEGDQSLGGSQADDTFDGDPSHEAIDKDDLKGHGMQLINLYL